MTTNTVPTEQTSNLVPAEGANPVVASDNLGVIDWENLGADEDEDSGNAADSAALFDTPSTANDTEDSPVAAAVSPTSGETPTATPEAAPVATQAKTPTTEAAATQQEAEKPAQVPQTPEGEKPTEPVQAPAKDWRADYETRLMKAYGMSEDEGTELIRNPHEVLPKLAARLHLDVTEAVFRGIEAILPQRVAEVLSERTQQETVEKAFYTDWPQLNKPEYRQLVGNMQRLHKQQFPKATQEAFVKEVGAAAMVALRLPMDEAAPAAPVVNRPFTPAQPGGGAPGNSRVNSSNVFESLSEEFLQDDS